MTHIVFADASPLLSPAVFETYYRALSPFRRQKADRLKNETAKRLSVAAGAALDRALGGYALRERDMDYVLSENGKPCFMGTALQFSLSHSGSMVMAAVGTAPLGCDIERIRPLDLKIARRYFTKTEYAALVSGKGDFFRLWTMKESYLKLTGRGLALALNSFEVDMTVPRVVGRPELTLSAFTPAEGYQAALCAEDTAPQFEMQTLPL